MMKSIASTLALLTAALLIAGCPAAGTDTEAPTPTPEESAPPNDGSAADETLPPAGSGDVPPVGAATQPSGEPTPEQTGAVCDFVPADEPVGGVACPEGCVLVLGAPIDEARGCARTGPNAEAALGCLRLPADLRPGGMCYRHPDGYTVAAALTYPALSELGWTECEQDYAYRTVAPCGPSEKGELEPEPADPMAP